MVSCYNTVHANATFTCAYPIGRDQKPKSKRNKDNSNDDKHGYDTARGDERVPGRQALLAEGRVCRIERGKA